ncbi:Hypothetical predicted protein [Pelobates cultripes]|uniref:Uncharacterized protein n=1 Tax=Pelobates cultripes TaxID=61616 RepID=A0AAD1REJ6_PELCU|nr:Hypothetical predicted protein [Pelobates cultripes]
MGWLFSPRVDAEPRTNSGFADGERLRSAKVIHIEGLAGEPGMKCEQPSETSFNRQTHGAGPNQIRFALFGPNPPAEIIMQVLANADAEAKKTSENVNYAQQKSSFG